MFIIYSKPNCHYCDMAKSLLSSKGYDFEEYVIDVGQEKLEDKIYVSIAELKAKVPTAKSVPQIFDDELYVGGFTELKRLLDE